MMQANASSASASTGSRCPQNASKRHRILSHFPNVTFNVVAIAASAGGLEAISGVLSALPANFPAAILVVQHLIPSSQSHLVEILRTRTALQVKWAEPGDVLRPGIVYTAVPNKHLLVEPDGTLSFSNSEKVNFTRPSADVLFRSLAMHYKARAIAVVLTGNNSDGALGVRAIKKYGGTVIVQDPAVCAYPHMPEAAIATKKADAVLSVAEIAGELVNQLMLDQFG